MYERDKAWRAYMRWLPDYRNRVSGNREWNLDYVYIATEDASYCEFFKERYGEKVFFTDQQRYVTKQNELLSEFHRSEEVKRAGFELGAEYAASINLLLQCNS